MRILAKHRGRQKYDCLCMLSGGKDSTAALYYARKRYGLNPLVFTFNHGFVPEETLAGIRRTVRILGVDLVTFESSAMKGLFRRIIRTGSRAAICPICSLWYMQVTYEIAARYDIPIIISGWTKGQTSSSSSPVLSKCACNTNGVEYASMVRDTQVFMTQAVREEPGYRDFPVNMEGVLQIAKKKLGSKATVVSPHWFLDTDVEAYVKVLRQELEWEYPARSYPRWTTNCDLNFLATFLTMKHYGFSHYHIEASKLIRAGLLTRDEALERLEIDFDDALLAGILARLDCTLDDI